MAINMKLHLLIAFAVVLCLISQQVEGKKPKESKTSPSKELKSSSHGSKSKLSIEKIFRTFWDKNDCPPECKTKGKDCRVYSFCFFPGSRSITFNGTTLAGPRKKLVEEICHRAHRRCEVGLVEFSDVLDNGKSTVLNDQWCDVSALAFRDNVQAAYEYSRVLLQGLPKVLVFVSVDSGLTLDNFTVPNNFSIAYPLSGIIASSIDTFDQDYVVNTTFLMPVNEGSIPADNQKIVDLVTSGQAQLGLANGGDISLFPSDQVTILTEFSQGRNVFLLTRKDSLDIFCWFDFYYLELICGEDYQQFCDDTNDMFGFNDLNCLSDAVRNQTCGF